MNGRLDATALPDAAAATASPAAPAPARIPLATGLGYGVGMIGERLFRDAPALLLLVFMTNYLAIPAAVAGLAVFLPKLALIVVDPLVGYTSDTSRSALGRRRPFLVAGAVLSAAGFVLMFDVPHIESTALRSLYMTVLIGGAFTVYSVYSVPYLSLAAEITDDPYQRTRLLGFRMAFLAIGLNLSASAGVLVERFGGGAEGYRRMALVYGLVCLVTMLVPALALRDPPVAGAGRERGALRRAAAVVWADRPYRRLLVANFLQKSAEGVGYGSFAYFFLYWLEQPLAAISACILASTVAQIVAQPAWVLASRRWSRTTCCAVAVVGYVAVNALWLAVPARTFWPVPVLGFATGAFGTGLMLMLLAMMSDVAAREREAANLRYEGIVSGIWLAIEKIGFAAGGMLVGFTLGAFGFAESSAGSGAPQSGTALAGIAIAYAGLSSALYLVTLALVLRIGRLQQRRT